MGQTQQSTTTTTAQSLANEMEEVSRSILKLCGISNAAEHALLRHGPEPARCVKSRQVCCQRQPLDGRQGRGERSLELLFTELAGHA